MKILFTLTQPFDPNSGGVQRSNYKMGKYLTEKGHMVSYFSLSDKDHVPVEYGTLYHAQEAGGETNPENMLFLEKTLAEVKPDLVINHVVYVKAFLETLGKLKGRYNYKLVGILRNSLLNFTLDVRHRMQFMFSPKIFRALDNPVGINLMRWRHWFKHRGELEQILKTYDKLVLLTPPNIKELKHFVSNFDENKVISISNTIPEIPEYTYSKEKIILHVGRLEESQKRVSLLIDFWANAYKQLPDWKFVIVGSGPSESRMKKRIAELGLERIEMIGHSNPMEYYKKASVFVMASGFEGFPNVIMEAQSYGVVPVVMNSYPAISWIVNDQKDAVLIEPFNTKKMAEETVKLTKDYNRIEKMREQARNNSKRYLIENVGKEWISLIEELKQ